MVVKFVNLTPHTVNIIGSDGELVLAIDPTGTVARCGEVISSSTEVDGITIVDKTFGDITDLPEEEAGTFYIVSGLVASAAASLGRRDVLSPHGLVRDSENPGIVRGCRGLSRQG